MAGERDTSTENEALKQGTGAEVLGKAQDRQTGQSVIQDLGQKHRGPDTAPQETHAQLARLLKAASFLFTSTPCWGSEDRAREHVRQKHRPTFPSIPIPQSAAWIMLTSFPPSPERYQEVESK